ncbi:MAG: hypothetical protein J0626_07270 [Rhodospirillaceae bacterium]|nr:hypothetical protein [Rhodospirillaceae bacterium]
MELAIDCRAGTHRIDRHLLLSRPHLDIAHDGVRTRINKRDIFGFRDCDGSVVRFVEGSEYAILSTGVILMYARSMMVPAGNREGYRIMREAIKNAFPAHHELHEALDAGFRNDDELGAFDGRHGVYRLQRMLTRYVGAAQVRE